MKRTLFVIALLLPATTVLAQESAPRNPKPPRHFYKLDYVLKESDEAKVVNQRSFVVSGSTGDVNMAARYASRLRAGSRFPVRDNEGKTNYIDVGVNIDNQLEEVPEGLAMDVTAEISSVATETANSNAPVIRQVKTNAQAVVPLNKPYVLFTVDDPSSRHRFELEVTAVPQK